MALIPAVGPFYRCPIKGSSPPCFSLQVVGKNTLQTIVKHICEEAGFIGNYTNHSGKVTCAMIFFSKNFDEQSDRQDTDQKQFRHTNGQVLLKMLQYQMLCNLHLLNTNQ